jgi:hypothetical protein
MTACTESDYVIFSLFLASMLLDAVFCSSILKHHREMIEPWNKTLIESKNSIYQSFAEAIDDFLE